MLVRPLSPLLALAAAAAVALFRRLEAADDGREVEGDDRRPGERLGGPFVHLVPVPAVQEPERGARSRRSALALVLIPTAEAGHEIELGADIVGPDLLDRGRQVHARRVELNLELLVEESMIRIRAFPSQCVSQGTVKGDALAEVAMLIHPRRPGHMVLRRAAVMATRRRPSQLGSRHEELGTAGRARLQF